jgi:hypothetical protein
VDGKAAFSLLRPVSSSGLQPRQLDPSRALPEATDNGGAAWRAAVSGVLAAADCLLAVPRQLLHPAFPLSPFGALIEYNSVTGAVVAAAPDSGSGAGAGRAPEAGAGPAGSGAGQRYAEVCRHFAGQHYKFVVTPCPDPTAACASAQVQRGSACTGPAAAGAELPPETAVEQLSAAAATKAAATERHPAPAGPSHAAQAAPAPKQPFVLQAAALPQHGRQPALRNEQQGPQLQQLQQQEDRREALPVVISGSPSSLLRRRRDLYECLLPLERQHPGAALVERPSERADIVLTPQACVCVWSTANLPLGGEVGARGLARGGWDASAA